MVSNKDINWIYDQIQARHEQAKGTEKSILGEVLGLFEAAPEPKGCAYCRFEMDLETDGGGELDLVRMIPLPAINLTTGENEKTAPPPYMALMFRAFEGEFEDYVPIRCCPMCGRLLKEEHHGR